VFKHPFQAVVEVAKVCIYTLIGLIKLLYLHVQSEVRP